MDLGATICLPKARPRCLLCPLMEMCAAQKNGTQEIRPVLKAKKISPQYVHAAAVIIQRGRALLAQRPPDGLLGGMWEFPNARVTVDPAKELVKALNAAYRLKVKRKDAIGVVQHAYTHFKVTVHAFRCEPVSIPKSENLKWVPIVALSDYPMGKVDRQIAKKL
jgi:A/G-specific adenine glycosylase